MPPTSNAKRATASTPVSRIAGAVRMADRVADKPTIRLVAKRARVAISTVSRVLNGGSASATARDRVLRAVRQLGYSPSVTAQSLVTRRAGAVGLVVNSSQNPWFSQILAGVEEALGSSRKSVLLASMMLSGRYDPSAAFSWIREGRVDGLIFARYGRRNHPLFTAATRAGLPVVLIAPDVPAPVPYTARCDNFMAGRLAAEHLGNLGHRRVAFAGGRRESFDMRQRVKGLIDGLSERGIEMREHDIWFGPSFGPEAGLAYGQKFIADLARDDHHPTAIVLGNDAMALGFLRAMWQYGVPVPQRVSVMGFDGIPEGALCWPALTTIVQPTRQMAADACRALLGCIEHDRTESVQTVEYGVEILVRESTAAPSDAAGNRPSAASAFTRAAASRATPSQGP